MAYTISQGVAKPDSWFFLRLSLLNLNNLCIFKHSLSLSHLLIIEKSILMGIPCLICYVRALYLFLGMYLVRHFLSLSSLLHRRNRRTLSRQRVFAFANGRKYLCLSS